MGGHPPGRTAVDLVGAAVHEAGHVVAEYALGHRIRTVRLDRRGGGRVRLGWRAWRPRADALVAALAGPAAEAAWLGVPLDVVLAGPGGDRDRVAVVEWLDPGEDQGVYARLAVEVVAGRWAAVARVAGALVVRRRLGHRQVTRLLRTAPHDQPAMTSEPAPSEEIAASGRTAA